MAQPSADKHFSQLEVVPEGKHFSQREVVPDRSVQEDLEVVPTPLSPDTEFRGQYRWIEADGEKREAYGPQERRVWKRRRFWIVLLVILVVLIVVGGTLGGVLSKKSEPP
jgi:hypothetical protein